MDAEDFISRTSSQPFTPDKDGPPPRKKVSRFFPEGKSMVGSLQDMVRKTSDTDENPMPLIENDAYIARDHSGAPKKGNTESIERESTGFRVLNEQDDSVQSSAPPKTAAPLRNRFSQAATAVKNLTVRDRRRDGIVGFEGLRRSGSGTPTAAQPSLRDGGDVIIDQPTIPFQSTLFQAETRPRRDAGSVPPSPEDAVRLPATYGNFKYPAVHILSSQSRTQQLDNSHSLQQSQQPASNPSQKLLSLLSEELRLEGPRLPSQEDHGLLNAPPLEVKPSKIPLNDTGYQRPFLPRPAVAGTVVDLDRDISGKKLPAQALRPILNIPNKGITNLPQHATLTPTRRRYDTPPTLYTSPDRIKNAILTSRKRKRIALIPPPPAFTYQRTNDPNFNIFNGILLYPELVFHLASILPLRDLISLYAVSRDFHTIIDTRFTTVVLSQSLRKAPECSRAFPFRCYSHLCRRDPAARIPHPNPTQAAVGQARLIPSFRWLALVLHREKVVHEIMALFAEDGVPLPKRCSLAIKRMWFILDIPDNARRIGYIHNVNLFTDLDLYFAMCFFVKLDMRMNDPVGQEKRDGMRKLLLAQDSFVTILKVLRRDMWYKQIDIMRAWIRYKYEPLPDEQDMSIFGVPFAEVGRLRWEYWGKEPPQKLKRARQLLLRPEQLVMREAVKRGLRFHKHFLRCLTYGYVRMDTLEDYEPRKMSRRKESLKDEYEIDDEIGGLTWSMEKAGLEGGSDGEMLDLGERKSVSLLCIEGGNKSMISSENQLKMKEQAQFLEACMSWSEAEREEGDVNARTLLG